MRKVAKRNSSRNQRSNSLRRRRLRTLEQLESRHLMAGINLSVLGTFYAPSGSTAEIADYDAGSQRAFYTSSTANALGILDLSDPASPELIREVDLSGFGGGPNSVAVKRGLVAVAIEAFNKVDAGSVVFFDTDGNSLGSVVVGALPDMLTFTPDGKSILVANEGEPNSYGQPDSVDPEGSVSLIDLSNGIQAATVTQIGFTQFNSQKDELIAAGIRIFGPGATVAQDLEPEYIAVSADGSTAFVTLQENNALAVIDLGSRGVTAINALGYKDHNQVSQLQTALFPELPTIGTTVGGQTLSLGGFSGLFFEGIDPASGRLKFVTHTDRGPNGEPNSSGQRPFLLPDFAPRIVRFELDPASGAIELSQQIELQVAPGDPLSGLPNTSVPGGNASTPHNDEVPVDLLGNILTLDPLGADLEGVVVDSDGSFWMVDEYRPAIYKFSAAGVLIERFVPQGAAAAAGLAAGSLGTEALPGILAQRRQNRGFEALAIQNGKLYAFVQSPLRNPTSLSNSTLNGLRNIRVVEFDPQTNATRQFLYVMDNPNLGTPGNTRADKIGDAVALPTGEFLVIERDDDAIDSDPLSNIEKKVYRFRLSDATDVSSFSGTYDVGGGIFKSIDQMTAIELAALGIKPISKNLHLDLAAAGYNRVEKVEGLALVDANTIAVINDNDFGVAGIEIDQTTGTFTLLPDYTPEPAVLGLITTRNGLDASDRDVPGSSNSGILNIRNWPVLGMYQPDAIASFQIAGQTYLVTANEGDARDYVGFNEEVRAGGLSLDPASFAAQGFPDVSSGPGGLRNNDNLGRLNVTSTLGNLDGDADYERLYAFGARSFSIWTAAGEQVFDSGDDFEQITAAAYPQFFNASNNDNSFDSRSDNKGPEPEAVMVAKIGSRTFAFIGLERIGGIMVYDVTDPFAPSFVQYINNRDFSQPTDSDAAKDLGIEDLKFISADDSPIGTPLVLTANEISGTVSVFALNLVAGAAIRDGVLEIVGTPGDDAIEIHRRGERLQLRSDFLSPEAQDFPLSEVESIHILLGAGDDQVRIATNVKRPVVFEGWSGADRLHAGGGPITGLGGKGDDYLVASLARSAVLVGGPGEDSLIGSRGRDLLIGGEGRDKIRGGPDQDILIGGTTIYDEDLLALAAISDYWNGPGSFASRQRALVQGIGSDLGLLRLLAGQTVLDDEVVDELFGESSPDWLFKFPGDLGH